MIAFQVPSHMQSPSSALIYQGNACYAKSNRWNANVTSLIVTMKWAVAKFHLPSLTNNNYYQQKQNGQCSVTLVTSEGTLQRKDNTFHTEVSQKHEASLQLRGVGGRVCSCLYFVFTLGTDEPYNKPATYVHSTCVHSALCALPFF